MTESEFCEKMAALKERRCRLLEAAKRDYDEERAKAAARLRECEAALHDYEEKYRDYVRAVHDSYRRDKAPLIAERERQVERLRAEGVPSNRDAHECAKAIRASLDAKGRDGRSYRFPDGMMLTVKIEPVPADAGGADCAEPIGPCEA